MNPKRRWWTLHLLNLDFAFTKRQLGQLLMLIGILGFTGILAIDLLNVGREGGIGPAQRVALMGCVGMALLGLTLLPLGDELA